MPLPRVPWRPDALTRRCHDAIRTCTYEDVAACTMYVPPMVFMIGPAALLAGDQAASIILQSLFGFAASGASHRLGHRLLAGLPQVPRALGQSRSRSLPLELTAGRFIWMMELLVGVAVFAGLLGKRCLSAGEIWSGLGCLASAVALYFLPVYVGRLWMERTCPAMTLVGPTDAEIKQSVPGIRSFLKSLV